jgi:REP element-mobilizing transposase RayT
MRLAQTRLMPRPRKSQISLDDTPYYHCVSRCVRRAFLCGEDAYSGRSFEHRRQWLVDRIKLVASVFAVDLCAYAVMSNHYHIVVHVNRETSENWSDQEVAEHWFTLFAGSPVMQQWRAGFDLGSTDLAHVHKTLGLWRDRLADISWFMRCVNEPIARLANHEDSCKGRFWEGRFSSQPLLDEAALLSCMAYVDLNPIRAAMAKTPEGSDYTSIQERIRDPEPSLIAFDETGNEGLPYRLEDYLDLVDWSGRLVREGKRGHMSKDLPPILQRLKINPEGLSRYLQRADGPVSTALGPVESIRQLAVSVGCKFLRGLGTARLLYGSG